MAQAQGKRGKRAWSVARNATQAANAAASRQRRTARANAQAAAHRANLWDRSSPWLRAKVARRARRQQQRAA